jgi:two-component sensor histidine kinase
MNTAQLSAADPPVEIRSADGVANRAQSHRRECAPDPGTRMVASELSVTQVDTPSAALHRFLQGVRRLWSADLAEQAREHRHALVLLESHQMAQQKRFAHDLAVERSLREQAETAESAIRHTLKFKDAVIQEANHRVKNTLQVAASLLSLHANSAASAEVRSTLQQSYNRLHVLARMHELLSASAESSQPILMPTLLQAVGDALRQSFAETSTRVRLQITSDAIELPPGEATALALLTNEVLTNAYKHAFPNGASGEVAVDFRCGPENTMILQITDSGVGMHSGSSQGLGLKLIHIFVAQLQGTLAIGLAGTAGTAVTLTIQRHAKKRQEHSQVSAR